MSNGVMNPVFLRWQIALRTSLQILKQGTRSLSGIKTEYRYRNFSIQLPADHLLPYYQAIHGTYDKFLPHLVRYMGSTATVIDVGANCGDTLAGMYDANDKLSYICVEPDEVFFRYLSDNAMRMRNSNPSASICVYRALVGKSVGRAVLEGHGGTKRAAQIDETSAKSIASVTLDNLVLPIRSGGVQLLKSDVDGYDYDVLDSAELLIAEHAPILFFECHFGSPRQKSGYRQSIESLQRAGYRAWTIFDNYGDVVLRTWEIDALFQMFDYVDRQNSGLTARTIHYFDVMANTEAHEALVTTVVSEYVRRILSAQFAPRNSRRDIAGTKTAI